MKYLFLVFIIFLVACTAKPPMEQEGKYYVSQSLKKCAMIDYACEEGKTHFHDEYGCGCEDWGGLVCAKVEVQCVTAPCDPVHETFENRCEAFKRGAFDIQKGACEEQPGLVVVTNFEECVHAGNPVMESYPRQCRHSGELFVEEIEMPQKEEVMEEESFRIEIPNEKERALLPECDGLQFSTFPVDINGVSSITPIGNLGPPGHTFPTDHPHLHMGEHGSVYHFDLYAPADVYLTSVAWDRDMTQDPVDYIIYFALCKDIVGYYNHVKTLSDEVKSLLEGVRCEPFANQKDGSCTTVLLDKVEQGTVLGTVGHKQGNFDFGLIDLRKPLDFVNPKRYPQRTQHIQCPFDYYLKSMRDQFYARIERTDWTCGTTMQDIPGTLKGNWFHESSPKENVVQWDLHLAFVDHFEDPSVQLVSIAGQFTEPSLYKFNPRSEGTINREFSQVTADGNVYCFEAEDETTRDWEDQPRGRIVVQMVSDTELKIEHQDGICWSSSEFSNPTTYFR